MADLNVFGDDDDDGLTVSRTPRKTRSQSERPQSWQPAATLPEPDKQPGFRYRWVRVSSFGQADPRNVSAKMREGWEMVRIEEQPHFRAFVDTDSRFKDNIEVAGLVLCKAPEELMEQRRKYYAEMNQRQMESVDNNFMRENDPRMPLFRDSKSSVSFGKGK